MYLINCIGELVILLMYFNLLLIWCLLKVADWANDGEVLLTTLAACQTEEAVLDVFKNLQGPYAFVFVQVSGGYMLRLYL